MRRALLNDVTIEEMRKMREAGMTNQDIADRLDVGKSTVYRYIGAQGGVGGRVSRTIPAPVVPLERKREEPVYPGVLPVVNRVTYLTGTAAEYVVDAKEQKITFQLGDVVAEVEFDKWRAFADEVQAVSRHLSEQLVTPELW